MLKATHPAGSSGQLTATPLKEATAKALDRPTRDSEFCRPGDCLRLFGLKRGYVYELEKNKLIRTCAIRRPGQVRGIKLIHVASVREFLHAQMEKSNAALAVATQKADSPGFN